MFAPFPTLPPLSSQLQATNNIELDERYGFMARLCHSFDSSEASDISFFDIITQYGSIICGSDINTEFHDYVNTSDRKHVQSNQWDTLGKFRNSGSLMALEGPEGLNDDGDEPDDYEFDDCNYDHDHDRNHKENHAHSQTDLRGVDELALHLQEEVGKIIPQHDDISFDSSLSSSCAPGENKVQIFFDVHLQPTQRCNHPLILQRPHSQNQHNKENLEESKDATLFEKYRDLMCQTPQKDQQIQIVDCDLKSGGGKYNPWRTNADIFDGLRFDHRVLGTQMNDDTTRPQVLTSSLMDTLQDHLPFCKRGESFWLRYSMVRDGSSIQTMIQKARGSKYTVLALETLEGEVFGAFCTESWHSSTSFFGTPESFLWKLRCCRHQNQAAKSSSDEKKKESEIDVFKPSGHNFCFQYCNRECIMIGGGVTATDPNENRRNSENDGNSCITPEVHADENRFPEVGSDGSIGQAQWGFALAFGPDLQEGTSSPCLTFMSPSLSTHQQNGSNFQVKNLELWTLTPCLTEDEAEKMENGRIFKEHAMTI